MAMPQSDFLEARLPFHLHICHPRDEKGTRYWAVALSRRVGQWATEPASLQLSWGVLALMVHLLGHSYSRSSFSMIRFTTARRPYRHFA